MLIALAWIKEKLTLFYMFILAVLEGTSLNAITATLKSSLASMICFTLLALLLCYLGFRVHKLVSGLVSSVMLGYIGWLLGAMIGPAYLSIQVLVALLLSLLGFFFLYLFYPVNVLLASFLLTYALCALVLTPFLPAGLMLAVALVFAVLYCILYVRHQKIMTSLTGAILLFLSLPDVFSLPFKAGIALAVVASGIWVQTILMRNAAARQQLEAEAYRVKYIDHPASRKVQLAHLQDPHADAR